jgi:hypothetical protein
MVFYIDTSNDNVKRRKKELVDWVKRSKKIDKFWRYELRKIIAHGGDVIKIKTEDGKRASGMLTGVHWQYLELNNSERIPLDDISMVFVLNKNDNPKDTIKEKNGDIHFGKRRI